MKKLKRTNYKLLFATSLAITYATVSVHCQPSSVGGGVMPPPYWNPLTAPGKNPVTPDYLKLPPPKVTGALSPELRKVQEQALHFKTLVRSNKLDEALKVLKTIMSSDLTSIDRQSLLSGAGLGRAVSHHGYNHFGQTPFIVRDLREVAGSSNYKFALAVNNQILEAEKKRFGVRDLRVAATLISIGDIYFSISNFKEALVHYRQSLNIQKLYMTEEYAITNLGENLREHGYNVRLKNTFCKIL